MSDNWEGRPIWIDPIGNQYRDMHPVSTHWVRYVPHSEAAAEIARLRAEVERLTAALADERAHADALAELVADQTETESEFWTEWDEQAAQAMQQHRARRQG
ncbi:hypothetical protein [Paracoccus sp. AS002]|uniref:hypothetical protein n=1 Tax=Paracoccus sp. AS002 TaxID=3019545 RepID=UPI0023E78DC9|nr:hypothetical protein [Paracoccus sp. AS002]MDF3904712.1 hypothetical protein [Paracoccus sp. AS002]